MYKQIIEFAVIRKNGNITRIGMAYVNQPKTNFKGGSVKWHEDKPKQADR